jgi:hypothetical protein
LSNGNCIALLLCRIRTSGERRHETLGPRALRLRRLPKHIRLSGCADRPSPCDEEPGRDALRRPMSEVGFAHRAALLANQATIDILVVRV